MLKLKMNTLLIALLAAVALSACSKNESPTGPTNQSNQVPNEVLGTWYYVSARVDNVSQPLSTILDWDSRTRSAGFVLYADGNYKYFERDANVREIYSETGTYNVQGVRLFISVDRINGTAASHPGYDVNWALINGDLVFALVEDGYLIGLTASRSPSAISSQILTQSSSQ